VGYDHARGEPRATFGRRKRGAGEGAARRWGDCIDCGACVVTCPTGIDIRDGLQMECIHCTQCVDACDAVMDRIGRPRGLIRYTSRDELAGAPRRILRPRIVLYPLLLALVWGGLTVALLGREPADITVLRGPGSPFALLPTGEVSNQIRVKIVNRSGGEREYRIEIPGEERLRVIVAESRLRVADGRSATATVFVTAPRGAFHDGRRDIRVRVSDDAGFSTTAAYRLLGPRAAEEGARHERDRAR
jgi:cytochrome c oxidase accessory protein FixG